MLSLASVQFVEHQLSRRKRNVLINLYKINMYKSTHFVLSIAFPPRHCTRFVISLVLIYSSLYKPSAVTGCTSHTDIDTQ